MTKQLLVIGLLFSSWAQAATPTSVNDRFGWLHGACLASKNAHLSAGDKLQITDLDTQASFAATIAKGVATPDNCQALVPERTKHNEENGWHFYPVATDQEINLAIAQIGDTADKTLEQDYCSTQEGLNFRVFKDGRLIWTGYYYLGYDQEDSCQ